MFEDIIVFVLLFVFNMVFIIKRVPIIGVPFGIITLFIGATYFLPKGEFDTVFCILIMFVGAMCLLINALYLKGENKA